MKTINEILEEGWDDYNKELGGLKKAKQDILNLILENMPETKIFKGNGCYECGWDMYNDGVSDCIQKIKGLFK